MSSKTDEPASFKILSDKETVRNVNIVKPIQRDDVRVEQNTIMDPKFSRALDFKLRRLKEKELLQRNLRRPIRRMFRPVDAKKSPRSRVDEKPRFITTVKTGKFLLPPPEVASLLGLENLYPPDERNYVYSYASKPKPVSGVKKSMLPHLDERKQAKDMFSGVRSLVAGVVGIRNFEKSLNSSSFTNLMSDKRVARGSNYASSNPAAHAAGDGIESAAARAERTRRRALAKRAVVARLRPGSPPPAPGRRHHPIQTEYFLEELFDKPQDFEIGVQTDLFVDRPPTPIYIPAKTGRDATTQIYPGELFDFDLEVQSILEVLVGKTSEQALAEVAQEEELATLREQRRRYVELRDAERAERSRLAAQDVRLHEEKERRVNEAKEAQKAAIEARERAAAAILVQGYIADLLPSVLAGLAEQGYLLSMTEKGVDTEFMPWLVKEVVCEIECIATSRDVITDIVREIIETKAELFKIDGEKEYVEPEDSVTQISIPIGEEVEE